MLGSNDTLYCSDVKYFGCIDIYDTDKRGWNKMKEIEKWVNELNPSSCMKRNILPIE